LDIGKLDIPESPGVYLMKKNDKVIYVGKAKNLKNRVSSYFNRVHENEKTNELVKNIEDIEFFLTNTEIDALLLENNLIKKYSPNESIAFRGDEVRGLYIILKGTLTTEMLTEEGNVIKIEELVPSDVIASAFVFGKKNSFPVDLNAKDEAEILFIERKEFLKILFSKEKILENFLNEVSNKTQLLTSKIWNSFNNKTIKKKFCDYVKKNQKNNKSEDIYLYKTFLEAYSQMFNLMTENTEIEVKSIKYLSNSKAIDSNASGRNLSTKCQKWREK